MQSSLHTFLATTNYPVLCATMGVNGNGGYTADAEDILADGHLDEYRQAKLDSATWEQHLADAGWEGIGYAHQWAAYDRHLVDEDGYMTGEIHRIYEDLGAEAVHTYVNSDGQNYYSTRKDGEMIYSWWEDFRDIWTEDDPVNFWMNPN